MRHVVFTISLVAAFAVPANAAQSDRIADLSPVAPKGGSASLAPADVQFGAYPMSVIGIANEIRVAGGRFEDSTQRAELEGGSFAYAIDAMRDWERHYPTDPAIARDLLAVARVYLRLHSAAGHEFAARTIDWLAQDYPGSAATSTARQELAATERPRESAARPRETNATHETNAPHETHPAATTSPWDRFATSSH